MNAGHVITHTMAEVEKDSALDVYQLFLQHPSLPFDRQARDISFRCDSCTDVPIVLTLDSDSKDVDKGLPLHVYCTRSGIDYTDIIKFASSLGSLRFHLVQQSW